MLRPLGVPVLASSPAPKTILVSQFPADPFFGLVCSLFTAVTFWMAYRILHDQFGKRRHPKLEAGDGLGLQPSRRFSFLLALVIAALVLLYGCQVQRVLTPSLPVKGGGARVP